MTPHLNKNQPLSAVQEALIEHLRHEIQSFGELLNLFKQQQRAVIAHQYDHVLELNQSIESSFSLIAQNKDQRTQLMHNICSQAQVSLTTKVKEILNLFSQEQAALVRALLDELKSTAKRAQSLGKQNFILLNKVQESTREFVSQFLPAKPVKGYSQKGKMKQEFGIKGAYLSSAA